MRKLPLVFIFVFILNITFLFAQPSIVITPQHRNIVLEEFTGIHCGYCPDGHLIAEEILAANPDRVVLINVHAGTFAIPNIGEPDFRTIFGEDIATEMGVSGYPGGTVNRHIFPEIGNTPSMDRTLWANASIQILPLQSPVNVGYTSTFDSITRELSVSAEVYYTANSPVNSNFLQVALLESHVIGFQADYTNGNQQNYDHKYILRHFFTGQWGYEISTTIQGTFFTETFTYTVPLEYDINNCEIAIYVSEDYFEVYTGVNGPANGGSHNGETSLFIGNLIADSEEVAVGITGVNNSFNVNMISSLAGDEEFEVTLSSENAPSDWSASYYFDGVEYLTTQTFTLFNYIPAEFEIVVNPGSSIGFVKYTLEVKSANFPNAESREINVYVVKGITDLIVNGTGGWGSGGSYNFDQNMIDGLDHAGNTSHALIDANVFIKAMDYSAIEIVNNIYLNIGWRFPSFSDDQAIAIMSFMDNGGNVFVCGQDMGWDLGSGNGYDTPTTIELYNDYFHALYNADGGSSNSEITAIVTDEIFGTMGSSVLIDIFGGNFYPDQVNPLGDAVTFLNYNGDSGKSAGIRFENSDYKLVYLCVDLAMVSDVNIQKEIIKRSHDWFYGLIGIEKIEEEFAIEIFPNPANDQLFIESKTNITEVEIYDNLGRKVNEIIQDISISHIDVATLKPGMYYLILKGDKEVFTRKIVIY